MGTPEDTKISGRYDIAQHSNVLSYLCHNFPMLTNRTGVVVTTGHIHWMIVVLCWSHRIACDRDNDVLLFHARISVLTTHCCVIAMVLLLGGINWRRTQHQDETSVSVNYNNCFVVLNGSLFGGLKLILISVWKMCTKTKTWVRMERQNLCEFSLCFYLFLHINMVTI